MSQANGLPTSTDWRQYDLWSVWAMLQPQSRASGEITVDMWRRMRTLCDQEADQIELGLRKLAERWPLTQPAAVAFQEFGAHLVAAMRGTADTAARNGPIVDAVTAGIEHARRTVGELLAQAGDLYAIEERQGAAEADRVYADRFIGTGSAAQIPWRAGLDGHAQAVMAELEQSIYNHKNYIAPAQLYKMPYGRPPTEEEPLQPGSIGHALRYGLGSEAILAGGLGQRNSSIPGASSGGGGGLFVDTPAGPALAPGREIATAGPAIVPGNATSGGAARVMPPGVLPVVPPMMGQPGAARSGSAGQPPGRRRGLPSMFEVPPGPPAVIRPSDEPHRHDPGPGVIGIDR